MANLVITAASVQPTADTIAQFGFAGEALTAGQSVYLAEADQRWYLAEAGDTVAKAESTGITFTNAATGAKVGVCVGGSLTIGATLVPKTLYVLSNTAGAICPFEDLIGEDWVSPLFVPLSTTVASMMLSPKRFQIPADPTTTTTTTTTTTSTTTTTTTTTSTTTTP